MHTREKLICNLALAAGIAFSQGRPSSLPQRTKMVALNVVAFDGHGDPVVDLRSEEFQVFDQGKSESITAFRRDEDVPQLAVPLADGASTRSGAKLPAMVILFDLLNANLSNRGYGADEIVHSLEHLESSESVYLYLLTNSGSLYPVHALPAAEADAGGAKTPWTRQIRPLLDAAMNNVYGLKPVDETLVNLRIEATYSAFEMLASRMASIPGRKNIVWITRGIPATGRLIGEPYDYSRRLQRLATALDKVGITVNSVNEGGVAGDAIYTFDQFAELTGGTVSTDFAKTISEAMNASRSSYVIQYAAPPPDGKYHKIRVTCSRKGIRIQTKQGYYANP
jgi:VWFA-related protein